MARAWRKQSGALAQRARNPRGDSATTKGKLDRLSRQSRVEKETRPGCVLKPSSNGSSCLHYSRYRFLSKAKNPQGGEHAHDGLNVGDVHAVSYHKPAKGMFSPVKNKLMVGTIQETAKGRTWVPSSHYFRGENRESKVKNSKKGKIPNDRPGSGYKIEYKGPVPQNTRPGHVGELHISCQGYLPRVLTQC